MSKERQEVYEFGDFRLNVDEHTFERIDGTPNGSLPEKAFQTLAYLVRNHGHLVTKKELLDEIWPDSFVEENNLDKSIHAIRQVLGERPGEQIYIETVRKHGYRFVAEVARIDHAGERDQRPAKLSDSNVVKSFPAGLPKSRKTDSGTHVIVELAAWRKLEEHTETKPKPFPAVADVDSGNISVEPTNAFQACQLASYHFNQMTPPDMMKSRALLEEALRLDANFAPAHAAFAKQLVQEVVTGFQEPAVAYPKARESLSRAFELDPNSAENYTVSGFVGLLSEWDFAGAAQNLRRALEINPHHAFANTWLGTVFMFKDQFDEAEPYLTLGSELDQTSLANQHLLAISRFLARRYDDAIAECDKMLAVYPRFMIAAWLRCWSLEQTGRAAEAVVEYEKTLREPHGSVVHRWLGYALALAGDEERALEIAAKLEAERREHYISPTHQAAIYAALNNTDRAFEYLEIGFEHRDPWMLWTMADPRFDNLRSDPRFGNLVSRITAKIDSTMTIAAGDLTYTGKKKYEQTPKADVADKVTLLGGMKRSYLTVAGVAAVIAVVLLIGYFSVVRPPAAAIKRSIAVLPFKPIEAASRNELYEMGIADSLINRLGSMKGFVVRPLSAMRKYADIEQDAIAAGKEQQVDYVLASNYQLADGKIRITAQLFNVASGQIEETYKGEKDAANIFAMQDAIAGDVGNILLARFALTSSGPAAKRGTTNEGAYRLYLQGIYLYDKRNWSDSQKSVELLEQAVKLDPNYALAWAGLAHAHRTVANFGASVDVHEGYRKSIEAIDKALALDENLSEAYSALCENRMYSEHDFDGAERACRRATELDPNSSLAHEIYSRYLNTRGRFDESIAESKTAIDLDPASLLNQRSYGITLYYARRFPEANTQLKRVITMDPNFYSAYIWLWRSFGMQGNYPEAFEWFVKAQEIRKKDAETIELFKKAYQISGWQGVLRERTRPTEEIVRGYEELACLNTQVGNDDKAFEYLEKAYQRREWGIVYLQVEPRYDSVRGDPRFDQLVKRVGLK